MELILIPIALTVSAAIVLWFGLRPKSKPNYGLVTVSLGLLFVVCGGIVVLSASDDAWGMIAFILSIPTTIIALIAGLALAVELRGRRKLASLIIAVIYPAALFGSAILASDYSPEALSRKYADVIGQQLDHYRGDTGHYPAQLAELVPAYLDDLREPKSIWGWLYEGTQDEFTLGYVSGVDRIGYSICLYTSDNRAWVCGRSSPFNLPPTPSSF